MKSFTKITLALTAITLLTACTVSSTNVKEKMEKENYDVSIVDGTDYEQASVSLIVSNPFGLDEYLYAFKEGEEGQPGNYLHVWFFLSIDDATSFNDFSSPFFNNIKTTDGAKFISGSKNNAVYYGTKDAVSISGLDKLF